MRTWVVGRGGLLGRELFRQRPDSFRSPYINWGSTEETHQWDRSLAAFASQVGQGPWSVIWAAGAAVTNATEATTAAELRLFTHAVVSIRENLPPGRGVFFLASSAGGVFAGASTPPFHEGTSVAPISAYGRLKVAQEAAAADLLCGHARLVFGRYSNLYGPGQNLRKQQGLISQLCLASLTHQVINLYVPLETMRDYLHVTDAARSTHDAVDQAHQEPSATGVRVICSGEWATIARLVDLVNRQGHRRCLLSIGVSDASEFQVRDLRLRSVREDVHNRHSVTLTIGVAQMLRHTEVLLQRAQFAG